ncbi:MAG: single-stranded-DNA-specific exonuclease RecJ [bacterium]|nr:single-stranded-DNA-specific exonuclease RecJ [bacterium]
MKKYEIREKINGNLIDNLLFHRGIKTPEEKDNFLNPSYEKHIHDPFLLKDAEKAAKRVVKAIDNNEKIVIYSDYDADGIPAGVIFHDFFKKIGFKNFTNYIPHRHDEGFGLNTDAIDGFIKEKIDLLITLDCGISDIEAVKLAQDNGIDVIITDHHEPNEILPNAFAIVNHKQKDCEYPEKILCGSGVAFKLIQAILKVKRFDLKEGHEKWLLDMVGLATLSDMVPLTGENRVLAHFGMRVLKMSPRKGLMRLLNHLKINQKYLSEDDISFMITPRINAASRMGVPMDAFRLLATDDDTEAHIFVEYLDKINTERKTKVATLVKEVKKIMHERHKDDGRAVIVVGNPDWRPSLLGLVANNLAEEFGKPAFLWGRDGDGVIKGSCRSGGTVSVVEIMRMAPVDTMLQYGGHFASGGFAVSNEKIHHLDEYLNTSFNLLAQTESIVLADFIDMELKLDDVSWETYREIEKLSPFGTGNKKPLFIFKNIKIAGIKEFGKEKNHLELGFLKENGQGVNAMGFFMNGETFENRDGERLKIGDSIDLVATMEKSMFRGRAELRMRIEDVI